MLNPVFSSRFQRDVKRTQKQGKDSQKLKIAIALLLAENPLPAVYRDHPLKHNWKDCRELHIEPDWLLIYMIIDNAVRFIRTGTHSELFGK
jgi:mRNA interferase YafQ